MPTTFSACPPTFSGRAQHFQDEPNLQILDQKRLGTESEQNLNQEKSHYESTRCDLSSALVVEGEKK